MNAVLSRGLKRALRFAKHHMPTILTITNCIGTWATGIFAATATPKALKAIEEKQAQSEKPLTNWEKVKTAAPHYIPAMLTGIASNASAIGSNSINLARQAELVGICSLTEKAYSDYRDKAKEVLGERKEDELHTAAIGKNVTENPPSPDILSQGKEGEVLFRMAFTKKDFWSTMEKVDYAFAEFRDQILSLAKGIKLMDDSDLVQLDIDNTKVPIAEFYRLLGLDIPRICHDYVFDAEYIPKLTKTIVFYNDNPYSDQHVVVLDFEREPYYIDSDVQEYL